MRGHVIEPPAAAVEARERRCQDPIALAAHDAETRITRGHHGERLVIIARPIADAARAPERPKRVAVTSTKIADLHRRPY